MKVNRWTKNLKEMLSNPWDNLGNPDHPDCPLCGNTMNFYGHDKNGDFPYGEGYWKCSCCGFKITENEL